MVEESKVTRVIHSSVEVAVECVHVCVCLSVCVRGLCLILCYFYKITNEMRARIHYATGWILPKSLRFDLRQQQL